MKLSKAERTFRSDVGFIVKDAGKHSKKVNRKLDAMLGKKK